jgi:hypothetical protein
MSHSESQNGPFCDAKWPILKNRLIFFAFLYGFFTVSEAFSLKKRTKIPTEFFGNFI